MSKSELLEKYKNDVEKVRQSAKELGLSDNDIDRLFNECLIQLQNSSNSSSNKNAKAQKKYLCTNIIKIFILFTLFAIFIYILLNVHQPTSSIVLRNVQGLIYPSMKIIRYLSVPVIKIFPSLTYLYDESCLVENPFFYVSDMDCSPCKDVYSVIDLTGIDDKTSYHSGAPFIVKTKQQYVNFSTVQETYRNNKAIFDQDAMKFTSTNSSLRTLQDVFFKYHPTNLSTTHISWRINRMIPARFIRKLFPRPFFLSEWSGQSVERYVMIDDINAEPYALPNTECSYVFMIQGSGERTVILKPSLECTGDCKTVLVVLKPSYVLWYNWWYWRPISLPTENSTEPSISYINSYC